MSEKDFINKTFVSIPTHNEAIQLAEIEGEFVLSPCFDITFSYSRDNKINIELWFKGFLTTPYKKVIYSRQGNTKKEIEFALKTVLSYAAILEEINHYPNLIRWFWSKDNVRDKDIELPRGVEDFSPFEIAALHIFQKNRFYNWHKQSGAWEKYNKFLEKLLKAPVGPERLILIASTEYEFLPPNIAVMAEMSGYLINKNSIFNHQDLDNKEEVWDFIEEMIWFLCLDEQLKPGVAMLQLRKQKKRDRKFFTLEFPVEEWSFLFPYCQSKLFLDKKVRDYILTLEHDYIIDFIVSLSSKINNGKHIIDILIQKNSNKINSLDIFKVLDCVDLTNKKFCRVVDRQELANFASLAISENDSLGIKSQIIKEIYYHEPSIVNEESFENLNSALKGELFSSLVKNKTESVLVLKTLLKVMNIWDLMSFSREIENSNYNKYFDADDWKIYAQNYCEYKEMPISWWAQLIKTKSS